MLLTFFPKFAILITNKKANNNQKKLVKGVKMKSLMFFVIIVFTITLIGQDKKWGTKEEAREAFSNGIYQSYSPQFFSGHKDLGVGEDTISFPQFTLVKMIIVGGRFWVIQDPWVKFVIKDRKIIRRWDCGNEVSGFYRLPTPDNPPPQIEKSVSVKTDSISINVNVDVKVSPDPRNTIPIALAGVIEENGGDWYIVAIVFLITAAAVAIAAILKPHYETPAPIATPTILPPDVITGGAN
ncbi:hypothetical protein COX93_00755 [Candidatus Nomurabacteria bacterium CG_4_10_14_0_2_um_filter_30_12]|nr:MAG: hypothetical protein AUJ22_01555 [Candidatus Nomurabacteria bacterium CG1_02_31_12]PIZ87510.1 MAG: hypothetical protein COX93_00755 [Candidatus Nomurabacteria bacterium CG_4_10_14_0_2_um_filter_30_12]